MTSRTLIVSLQGIGNSLLALPLARALYENGEPVTLLTLSPRARPLLEHVPFLAATLAAGETRYQGFAGRARLWRELRRRRFSRAIFSYPSGANAYRFIRLAGIPERLGHRYTEASGAWHHLTLAVPALTRTHDLDQNRQLLAALGLPAAPADCWPVLSVPNELRAKARAYLAGQGLDPEARYLGLHTGCDGLWVEKRWPEEHFAALAEEIFRRYGLPAIVFDGPAEPGTGRRVARLAKTPVHALDGYGELTDAWGLLSVCDLFVANDSGLMNLAAASGVPTVAVFGPSEPHRTRPYGPRGRAVVTERTCAPCYGLGPYPGCPHAYAHCLAGLPPARVLAAAEDLLRR